MLHTYFEVLTKNHLALIIKKRVHSMRLSQMEIGSVFDSL